MHRGEKKALIKGFIAYLRVVDVEGLWITDEEYLDNALDEYLPTDLKEMGSAEREMAEYERLTKEQPSCRALPEYPIPGEAAPPIPAETVPSGKARKDSMLDGKELGSFANTEVKRETLSRPKITDDEDDK